MKFEVVIARAFLVCMSIVISVLVAEFFGSKFLPKSRSPIENILNIGELRKPKPYVMFGGTPGSEFYANKGERLNELGYRGKAPSAYKAPGEFRIFLLGGSTVLLGNPTLAKLIEDEFHRNGHSNITVFNFGVISSVSGMELSRIIFEIVDLKPDLVIMYGGGNDFMHPAFYDPRPGYPFNFMVYASNPILESDIKKYPTTTMLLYGSNMMRNFFPDYFLKKFVPIKQLREESKWKTEPWTDEIVFDYVNNLRKAAKICQAFDSKFIAFLQPLVYFKEPLSPEEKVFLGEDRGAYLYMRDRVKSYVQLPTQSSLELVDLSQIFNGKTDRAFSDPIHLIQAKNAVVAKEMYDRIVKKLR